MTSVRISPSWRFVPIAALVTAVILFILLLPPSTITAKWEPWADVSNQEDFSSIANLPDAEVDADEPSASQTSSSLVESTIASGQRPTFALPIPPPINASDLAIRLHPNLHNSRPASTIRLDWNITKSAHRPDGVLKSIHLINGHFPGPAIELRSGDDLHINVFNNIGDNNEGVAIHWHGLRIANDMDGAVGVTQCAIRPGNNFTYHLRIPSDQSGTFWYHSHSDIQRADGLYGPMIVHRPQSKESQCVGCDADNYDDRPAQGTAGSVFDGSQIGEATIPEATIPDSVRYGYTHDRVVMIGDWYHSSAADVLARYTDWKNFQIDPVPDSLLLNGVGYFDCSKALHTRPVNCQQAVLPSLTLPPGRTRLRLINVGALNGFSLSTTAYTITIVEVDGGHPVKPISSSHLGVLYPGERIDVVVEPASNGRHDSTDIAPGWITIDFDRENMRFPNLALTTTQQFPIAPDQQSESIEVSAAPRHKPDAQTRINLQELQGVDLAKGALSQSESADHIVSLYATISYLTEFEYKPKGFINHTSWVPSEMHELPLLSLDSSSRDSHRISRSVSTSQSASADPLIPLLPPDAWVDIVVNNNDGAGHPFHLHGHDFAVVSSHAATRIGAFDSYDPFDSRPTSTKPVFNFVSPLFKDTVYVPARGFVVLRIRTGSPGLWMMHCHVLWHQAVGMNVAFEVPLASVEPTGSVRGLHEEFGISAKTLCLAGE